MLPLLHHGMLIVGVPYTERDLYETTAGGTPYGASHLARDSAAGVMTDAEKRLAMALGRRLARVALQVAS
jgi:NAD(P)H dehydrogenase (quinone)